MAVKVRSVPAMNINLGDPDIVRNPWPMLEEMRSKGPAVYNEVLNAWMVPGHRNCARIMGDAVRFTTEGLSQTYSNLFGGETMTFDDTPRHDSMKAVWSQAMQRGSLVHQSNMVEEIVDRCLLPFVERMRAGEVLDARRHLTRGIPTMVIARMMGIPEQKFEEFGAWSDAMGGLLGAVVDKSEEGKEAVRVGTEATRKMNEYAQTIVVERRRHFSDDLVGKLVTSDVAKNELREQDIVASITQLVFAGNETTSNLLGLIMIALAQHPDQRRLVQQDRSLVPAVIDEVLRWSTPVAVKTRHARNGNAEIEGIRVPDGDMIVCLPIAANRDPERWERPDEFNILRPSRQHIGFGFGKHLCLGLNLARLEADVFLNRMLDELPDWQIVRELDYGRNFWMRGPKEVMLASA